MRIDDMFKEDDLMARVNYSAIRNEVHKTRSNPLYMKQFIGKNKPLNNDGLDVPTFKTRKENATFSEGIDHTHTKRKKTTSTFRKCEDVLKWLALSILIGVIAGVATATWLIVAIGCIKLYLYMLWP